MDGRLAKAAALALGCAAAAALYVRLEPALRWRAEMVGYRMAEAIPHLPVPGTGPWRYWIPEEIAVRIFPITPPATVYDPFTYFGYPGQFETVLPFAEHPGGRVRFRANSRGLRNDREPRPERPELRVLVTGDSHTDGVVENDASFAGRLEDSLARARPERSVEVLNAGKGGFTFFHYLGALERYRDLRPHVFVVAVYGGNDFEELLALHHAFARTDRPPGAEGYERQMKEAVAIHGSPAQGLVACKYFDANPDQVDVSLDAALRLSSEIAELARSRGTAPLFVYLPPPYAPFAPEVRPVVERMLRVLELEEADLRIFDAMADRWLAGLASRGIAALDLRPAFRAERRLLYWLEDHHLNIDGHALVARELERILDELALR